MENALKVPVPATKLERTESRISTQTQNWSFAAPGYMTKQEPRHGLLFDCDQVQNSRGDGFDTDAGGLDDTTTISGGYDDSFQSNVPQARYIGQNANANNSSNSQARFLPETSHEQRQDCPGFNYFAARGIVVEGESESYGESEEGDEGGIKENEEHELGKEAIPEPDGPDFTDSPPEAITLSEEQRLGRRTDFIARSKYGLKNGDHQFSKATSPSPSHAQNPGDNNAVTNADSLRRGQERASASMRQSMSLGSQKSGNGLIRPPQILVSPTAFQQEVVGAQLISGQPQAITSQSSSFKLASQVSRPAEEPDHTAIKNNSIIESRGMGIPPAAHSKHVAGTQEYYEHPDKYKQVDGDPGNPPISIGYDFGTDESIMPGGEVGLGADSVSYTAADEDIKERKRGRELDYSLDQLAGMKFQQLNEEAFHDDPHGPVAVLPPDLAGKTLMDKLNYLVGLENEDAKSSQQVAFLSSLPIEEYEECGDLIVERFSDMVKKFKGVRRERRKAAKEFEEEIAKREECVCGKIKAFEDDLDRLKRSGADVVRKRLAM